MSQFAKIGIIIPALNEEKSLGPVVSDLIKVLRSHHESYQIIIINDGSTDKTGEVALELTKKNDHIKLIHHKEPQNIGRCYQEALTHLDTEYITWWPSDGEIPPELLDRVLPKLDKGKIIIPYPKRDSYQRNFIRRSLSFFYQAFFNFVFSLNLKYFNANAFIPRDSLKDFQGVSKGFSINVELLIYLLNNKNASYEEIGFKLHKRTAGEAKAISISKFFDVLVCVFKIVKNYRFSV